MNTAVPIYSNVWYRHKSGYTLKVRNGRLCIVPKKNSSKDIEKYQPLDVPSLEKQKHEPADWQDYCYLHLANLNVRTDSGINEAAVLNFVNKWGLLGLSRLDNEKKRDLGIRAEQQEEREDSFYFFRAVEEYQSFFKLAFSEGNDIHDKRSEASDILNKYLTDCRPVSHYTKSGWIVYWQAPSLLHTCYLQAWLALTSLAEVRKCQYHRCEQYFPKTKANQTFCSERCKNNHFRILSYRKNKKSRLNADI